MLEIIKNGVINFIGIEMLVFILVCINIFLVLLIMVNGVNNRKIINILKSKKYNHSSDSCNINKDEIKEALKEIYKVHEDSLIYAFKEYVDKKVNKVESLIKELKEIIQNKCYEDSSTTFTTKTNIVKDDSNKYIKIINKELKKYIDELKEDIKKFINESYDDEEDCEDDDDDDEYTIDDIIDRLDEIKELAEDSNKLLNEDIYNTIDGTKEILDDNIKDMNKDLDDIKEELNNINSNMENMDISDDIDEIKNDVNDIKENVDQIDIDKLSSIIDDYE